MNYYKVQYDPKTNMFTVLQKWTATFMPETINDESGIFILSEDYLQRINKNNLIIPKKCNDL